MDISRAGDYIFSIASIVVGLAAIFFPRRFQEQAIRDYKSFTWRHLTSFANRVDKPGYLIEVKICGIVAIFIGGVALLSLIFGHTGNTGNSSVSNVQKTGKYPEALYRKSK